MEKENGSALHFSKKSLISKKARIYHASSFVTLGIRTKYITLSWRFASFLILVISEGATRSPFGYFHVNFSVSVINNVIILKWAAPCLMLVFSRQKMSKIVLSGIIATRASHDFFFRGLFRLEVRSVFLGKYFVFLYFSRRHHSWTQFISMRWLNTWLVW